MRRAYQASLSVQFVVEAESHAQADELADAFVSNLAAWVDGGLGSPPFSPWLTAWYEDPLQPLEFTQDQLANWSPVADPMEPFALDDE